MWALTSTSARAATGYTALSRLTVITDFVGTPFTMLLTIALIIWGKGLWGYIFAQVISAVVVLALLLRLIWKLTPSDRSSPISWRLPETQVVSFSVTLLGIGLL